MNSKAYIKMVGGTKSSIRVQRYGVDQVHRFENPSRLSVFV